MRIDIERPTFTATPELKKLTKAVFDGLPAEYIYSGVDADGEGYVYEIKPTLNTDIGRWLRKNSAGGLVCLGKGYDPTNWQNSLIERAVESVIDWSKAPEGATHAMSDDGNTFWLELQKNGIWCGFYDGCFQKVSGEPEGHVFQRPPIPLQEQAAQVWNEKHPEGRIVATAESSHDPVNSPSHYASGGIECIDAMQAMLSREEFIGYLRGNIFKYQWRYKLKNGVEDLKKAQWYANRLIKLEQGE